MPDDKQRGGVGFDSSDKAETWMDTFVTMCV